MKYYNSIGSAPPTFYTINQNLPPPDIIFQGNSESEPILKLCANGDIYVHGRIVSNDIEVVTGLREFLKNVK